MFTAIPDEHQTRLAERFTRIADPLADEPGVDPRFAPVHSCAASMTAFRSKQVQQACFGGLLRRGFLWLTASQIGLSVGLDQHS